MTNLNKKLIEGDPNYTILDLIKRTDSFDLSLLEQMH